MAWDDTHYNKSAIQWRFFTATVGTGTVTKTSSNGRRNHHCNYRRWDLQWNDTEEQKKKLIISDG